jgi:hypothetical protein
MTTCQHCKHLEQLVSDLQSVSSRVQEIAVNHNLEPVNTLHFQFEIKDLIDLIRLMKSEASALRYTHYKRNTFFANFHQDQISVTLYAYVI